MRKINYHEWNKIYPDEVQNREHKSYIDIAAFKVNSVYLAFSYFDYLLKYCTEVDSWDEGKNKTSKIFSKSAFAFSALFYINNCREYIWQMLWCYIQFASDDHYNHNKLEKLCILLSEF